jgi:hypothetical protein
MEQPTNTDHESWRLLDLSALRRPGRVRDSARDEWAVTAARRSNPRYFKCVIQIARAQQYPCSRHAQQK